MPKDPIIAIRDCLTEIAILQEIAGRMTRRDSAMIRLRAAPQLMPFKPFPKPSDAFPTNRLPTSRLSPGHR